MTPFWNNTRLATGDPAPAGGLLTFGALASVAAAVIGLLAGWPLWALALVALVPWLPAFISDVTWTRHRSGAFALLYVLAVTQGGHFLEHLSQMVQIHVLGLSGPDASGVFGQLNAEWVHFVWNTWVIAAALVLLWHFRRNRWLWVLVLAAAWHATEHVYILSVYLTTGQAGTPGLLAASGLIGGGLPLDRADLHFLYNLIEMVPLVIAFVLELRRLPASPSAGVDGTGRGLMERALAAGQGNR